MRIFMIGANGYIGSEIDHIARGRGYEVVGTCATKPVKGLVHFRIEDQTSWKAVNPEEQDVVIWAAIAKDSPEISERFTKWLRSLPKKTVLVYLSSDIVLCSSALQSKSDIGDYARGKQLEQEAVLARPNSACFTIGPVFGTNSRGETDKRTKQLLESHEKKHEYWRDVYKTFVPLDGLMNTLFMNLDKRGHYFIGPPQRDSFFDFYVSRAKTHGKRTDSFVPTTVSDIELGKIGQCRDISYGDRANRLWTG